MQSIAVTSPGANTASLGALADQKGINYDEAERQFIELLNVNDLDENLHRHAAVAERFEIALDSALAEVYERNAPGSGAAHLFLQRVLYRINRLKFFWYDDLRHYVNERSEYLRAIRDRVEAAWQRWELAQLDTAALEREDIVKGLTRRAGDDLSPPPVPSIDSLFFQNEVGEAGYRRLLAIASLDGLVEASQLSRTLGGVANEIHAVMTRLLVEEYGGGRLARKHSSFFTVMLTELGMRTEPEAYFDLVPWEVLATINHSFLLSERKRFYLRYIGGLLYTETSVPAGFAAYQAAAERLGLSEGAGGYWDLHIKEDERHGRWMLHDVALPLAARYPNEAWELLLGYDQQKLLAARAGASVARAAREADREAVTTAARFMTAA